MASRPAKLEARGPAYACLSNSMLSIHCRFLAYLSFTSYAELLVLVELRKNLAGFEILSDGQEGFVVLIH